MKELTEKKLVDELARDAAIDIKEKKDRDDADDLAFEAHCDAMRRLGDDRY